MPVDFLKDQELEKLQSRLRVVANGKAEVNAIRAEHLGCLRVNDWSDVKAVTIGQLRSEESTGALAQDAPLVTTMDRPPSSIDANVFVTMTDPDSPTPTLGQTGQCGQYRTATVRLSDLQALAESPDVAYVELGESIRAPQPLDGGTSTRFPRAEDRAVGLSQLHRGGEDVLVGIIDVQGYDFSHEDFVNETGTRFVALWDQGGSPRGDTYQKINGNPVNTTHKYGIHLDEAKLKSAQRIAVAIGVRPEDVEPQSQQVAGSHATHVTSIAAGNRGLCPNAKIAGVTVSLADAGSDRRLSFYDSTRLAHAVDYLFWVAEQVGAKAVSINISLGTNGGAHDGSEALSRWIDSALTKPGRAVTVAAGNAGQENPTHENDLGFLMGRIHTEGKISAAELTHDLDWIVVGNGISDISENELEIWYSPQDRFAVQIRPPNSSGWLRLVEPGEYIENEILMDKTVVSVYNELYHQSNGANKISVFLSPFMSPQAVVGVKAGRWTVRLVGRQVRHGGFHGWIERDDPRPLRREQETDFWRFPSYFGQETNIDRASISSLACGPRVIAVANLDAANDAINRTSSQGPTRDGSPKPDVAAPGTDILAANGFQFGTQWIRKTGTSMASPYVAGVIGLMLATNPQLTAAQIRGILQRTAQPLPGGTFDWLDDAGYGVIDPIACVQEAMNATSRKDLTGTAGRATRARGRA